MTQETVSRLPELRRRISNVVGKDLIDTVEIFFQEEVTSPKYRITIDVIEADYFIDGKGRNG